MRATDLRPKHLREYQVAQGRRRGRRNDQPLLRRAIRPFFEEQRPSPGTPREHPRPLTPELAAIIKPCGIARTERIVKASTAHTCFVKAIGKVLTVKSKGRARRRYPRRAAASV
jgi:hypothetical protein